MADNVTAVTIANLALGWLGTKRITTALSEIPAIDTAYETAIQTALVFQPWTFAKVRQNLEKLAEVPLSTRYSVQYRLPTTPVFLRAIEINDEPEQFVDYQIETFTNIAVDPVQETRVALCSIDPPVTLRFLGRVSEAMFGEPFMDIASLYLALATAEALAPKASIKQTVADALKDRRDRLAAVDAHQGSNPQAQRNNTYLRARLRRRGLRDDTTLVNENVTV